MRPSLVVVAAAAIAVALSGCQPAQAQRPDPSRQWHTAYNGYGHIWERTHGRKLFFTIKPARATSPASTHAALVLSSRRWRNLTAMIRVHTNYQLRHPHPNPWEVGWFLWHYTDDHHFYYILLKPNGWELGKEDPRYPGGQRFLVTATSPRFPPAHWYDISVRQRGAVIDVDVDGHRLVRFVDRQRPYLSGMVGLYVEDASATFQPVSISKVR